jgi:hypothetical protein
MPASAIEPTRASTEPIFALRADDSARASAIAPVLPSPVPSVREFEPVVTSGVASVLASMLVSAFESAFASTAVSASLSSRTPVGARFVRPSQPSAANTTIETTDRAERRAARSCMYFISPTIHFPQYLVPTA